MRAFHLSSAFFLVFSALNTGTDSVSAASCAERVSSGDKSMGLTALEDAACASGGLGCFPDGDQCRFCKTPEATTTSHLKMCSEIQVSYSSAESNEDKTKPAASDSLESSIDCISRVSVGDQGVGISAVSASTSACTRNSLGCFESNKCRLCQSRPTVQSAPFPKCSIFGRTSTSPPAYTPSPTAASTSTRCSTVVSTSGLEGISYVSESRCNVASPTLVGCSARTSCRLCRNYKNEANQYLVSCQVLKDQGATESTTNTESTKTDLESTGKTKTESVVADSSVAATVVPSSGMMSVSTKTEGDAVAKVAGAGPPIIAAAAVVALLVVVMMSVIYVKGRRDPMDECVTPDDGPGGGLMTPQGRGYTPREGSLVMVVSQTSIATL